jgi:hypothetical protein
MTEHDYNLYIDSTKMPPPAREGIQTGNEIIWSENAGRTASCLFVGDVRAVKKTLTITWNELTYSEVSTIKNHISRVGHPWVRVEYTDIDGDNQSFDGYTEGLKGGVRVYDEKGNGRIIGVTLNIVER